MYEVSGGAEILEAIDSPEICSPSNLWIRFTSSPNGVKSELALEPHPEHPGACYRVKEGSTGLTGLHGQIPRHPHRLPLLHAMVA